MEIWRDRGLEVQRAHPLLDTAPVDDGTGLEDAELVGEHPPLLLEVEDGGLAENDAVDGARRRGGGRAAVRGGRTARGGRRRRGPGGGGAVAEGCAQAGRVESRGDGLDAGVLHDGGSGKIWEFFLSCVYVSR